MPASLLDRLREKARFSTERRHARPALLLLGFGGAFLLGLGYHLAVWYGAGVPGPAVQALYQMVVLLGYGALWLLTAHLTERLPSSSVSVFWTAVLACVLFLILFSLIVALGSAEAVAFGEAGYPLTLPGMIQMHLRALLSAGFAFVLLRRLRRLVLFKRTRRSLRNWRWMLGLMALAALTTFMRPPASELGVLATLFILPAVLLMAVNAFRLSWIILLSFREKLLSIGLTLGLMALLSVVAWLGDFFEAGSTLRHYSYPLSLFVMLTACFGLLYGTAAFLSLLFHLPTTSDFQRKADEMAAMHALTHLVSQAFDREQLTASVARSAVEAGSAQAAWLALAPPPEAPPTPRVEAAHNVSLERVAQQVNTAALYDAVRQQEAPLLLREAPADPRVRARPGAGFDSLLAVPLFARETLLGVLFAVKDVMHGFEKDDIEAISMFAAQAALALDHARLFEERLEKERIERELYIARTVQQRLLPSCTPTVPGLALCASSTSAQEVGGDYYDFLTLPDGRLAFIVADVSGKGTSAAFYMAEMQGIFQSISRLAPEPPDFLTYANEVLGRALEKNVFISVIYGLIDPDAEELVLARAGHCPAATINLHGEARFLRPRGLGLGLDRGPLFRQTLTSERLRMRPGDVFVLYTDGLVESRNADGEEYGYERLLDALRDHRHEEADDLHAELLGHLRTFTGRDAYDDDTTVVVLKWHGAPSPAPLKTAPSETVSQTTALDPQ